MDLDNKINQLDEEVVKDALITFLNKYTSPAFGALPKNEVELLVLDLLESLGAINKEPEIYELVSNLKINRSKARTLIYNRELRRSSSDDLDKKLIYLLKRPLIQKNGEQFILEIDNPLVSDHLRSKVKKLGFVSDGSFSPSIVKLGLNGISALTESLLNQDDRENVREALVRAGAPDASLRGVLKATFKMVAKKVASDAGEALMDNASQYLSPILDSALDAVTEKASELFEDEVVEELVA